MTLSPRAEVSKSKGRRDEVRGFRCPMCNQECAVLVTPEIPMTRLDPAEPAEIVDIAGCHHADRWRFGKLTEAQTKSLETAAWESLEEEG